MNERQRKYDMDEFFRRGTEMYEKVVRPQVGKPENKGRFVAVDIETGDFEVDDDELTAAKRLIARSPDVQIYGVKIGYKAARRFGSAEIPEDPL
jgi:hypothetical protein